MAAAHVLFSVRCVPRKEKRRQAVRRRNPRSSGVHPHRPSNVSPSVVAIQPDNKRQGRAKRATDCRHRIPNQCSRFFPVWRAVQPRRAALFYFRQPRCGAGRRDKQAQSITAGIEPGMTITVELAVCPVIRCGQTAIRMVADFGHIFLHSVAPFLCADNL